MDLGLLQQDHRVYLYRKRRNAIKEEDEQNNSDSTGWTTETPLALKLCTQRAVDLVFAQSLCLSW